MGRFKRSFLANQADDGDFVGPGELEEEEKKEKEGGEEGPEEEEGGVEEIDVDDDGSLYASGDDGL